MRSTEIYTVVGLAATANGPTFLRNTRGDYFDNRENIPVQIVFGAGTGGTVEIQGRLRAGYPWRTILAGQTADFHGTVPYFPEIRAAVTVAPTAARTINVAVGDDRILAT